MEMKKSEIFFKKKSENKIKKIKKLRKSNQKLKK